MTTAAPTAAASSACPVSSDMGVSVEHLTTGSNTDLLREIGWYQRD
jgi:hypothetical protein